MAGLGVSLGSVLPDTLVEEVGHLLDVIGELELSTARRTVHRVLVTFESHCQGLDHMTLSGGWALGTSDMQCDELKATARASPVPWLTPPERLGAVATRRTRGPGKPQALNLDVSFQLHVIIRIVHDVTK
jgi:hypothetical protein